MIETFDSRMEIVCANMSELDVIENIASSESDTSVLMINLNRYAPDADYPNGQLYKDYMAKLHELVDQVNGKVLWRTSVHGQVVGSQELHEVLGIWYPSHRAFLNLMSAPASEENMRLRKNEDLYLSPSSNCRIFSLLLCLF